MKDICKGCGAEIRWLKTSRGKNMPVNPGETTIITNGGVIYRGFVPHWVTCPEANGFKKKKEHTPGIGSLQWQCSGLSGCGAWNVKGHACKCGATEPNYEQERKQREEGAKNA